MGNTVKEYSQMIGFLTRDKTSTVPRSMVQDPRNMYAGGQLVRNTVDGSRPGYSGSAFTKALMLLKNFNKTGAVKGLEEKLIKKYKSEGMEFIEALKKAQTEAGGVRYEGRMKIIKEAMDNTNIHSDDYVDLLDMKIKIEDPDFAKQYVKFSENLKNKTRSRHDSNWAEANFGEEYGTKLDQARVREINESIDPNITERSLVDDIDDMNTANIDEFFGRKKNADGGVQQLVSNTVDGSRPGYNGDKPVLSKDKFVELRIKYKNTHTNTELAELLNEKWKPAKAEFFNKDNIAKRIKDSKNLLPDNFDYKGSHIERALTSEKYISLLGEKEYARLKDSPTKLKDRYEYELQKKNNPNFLSKRAEKNRLSNRDLSKETALNRKEKAIVRRQSVKGYSFYKVNKAENLLWNDLLRTAKNKNGYFTFKGEAPVKKKYYNKAATENFVLVDKKGNEFKYSTLSDDITKHSGYKLDDVLRPYKQKEFLATEGLTKELNKLAGYELGSPKSVFHTQHIEGIDKNPWKVHLTFGTQNITESASRKSFNADWKAATYVDDNGKTKVRLNDVGKIGDANYKPGGKTAVNRYYKSLGPDIVAQIGKKPKGEIKTLIQLLDKTGIKLTDTQRAGAEKLTEIQSKGIATKLEASDFKCTLANGLTCNDPRAYTDSIKENMAKASQGDKKAISNIKKMGKLMNGFKGAAKWTGWGLLGEIGFAAPLAGLDYAKGANTDEIISNASYGLFGKSQNEQLQEKYSDYGQAQKFKDTYDKLVKQENSLDDQTGYGSIPVNQQVIKDTENKLKEQSKEFAEVLPPSRGFKGDFNLDNFFRRQEIDQQRDAEFAAAKQKRSDELGIIKPSTGLEALGLAEGGLANLMKKYYD